jgi:GTP-binding protein HflX
LNRALLITYPDKYLIEEAEELAKAAGYEPSKILTQDYLSKAKFGVGKGKAEEAAKIVKEISADLVIFDSKLKTTQAYNLAELCHVEVKDREKIILEIFAKRATTAEAKLQVQLAELEYELPKAKNRVRMAKRGEQPGFFGLGKYEVDVYVRMMKRRIAVLREKVRAIEKRREIFRRRRDDQKFPALALAGYTAAGKTTLFNHLTREAKEVDAGVFTTLAPTTRGIVINKRKVLITDTVGFISNLPTYMIEAFKSTLEEVSLASVVLLLVDASQPEEKFLRNYDSSVQTLGDLQVSLSKALVLLNKCDLTNHETVEKRKKMLGPEAIPLSAKTGDGVDELLAAIEATLEGTDTEAKQVIAL